MGCFDNIRELPRNQLWGLGSKHDGGSMRTVMFVGGTEAEARKIWKTSGCENMVGWELFYISLLNYNLAILAIKTEKPDAVVFLPHPGTSSLKLMNELRDCDRGRYEGIFIMNALAPRLAEYLQRNIPARPEYQPQRDSRPKPRRYFDGDDDGDDGIITTIIRMR